MNAEVLTNLGRGTLVEVFKLCNPPFPMGRNASKAEIIEKLVQLSPALVERAVAKVQAAARAAEAAKNGETAVPQIFPEQKPQAVGVDLAAQPKAGSLLEQALTQMIRGMVGKVDTKVDAEQVAKIVEERFSSLSASFRSMIEEAVKPRIEKVVIHETTKKEITVGRTHKAFDRVLKLAQVRHNTMLVGPSGCGKTHLAEQVAKGLDLPFYSVSCSIGMSESQLTGWLLPIGDSGRFVYVPATFVKAYEEGGVFLLDEMDRSDANVLLVLNQALANGRFFIPQRHENPLVKRHKDFVLIAAANTFGHGADMVYAGAEKLDGATLDRFRSGIVHMDYDADLERELIDKSVLKWGLPIRQKINDCKLRRVMSTRVMRDFTEQKQAHGWGVKEWEQSYFADWTRDERAKVGK